MSQEDSFLIWINKFFDNHINEEFTTPELIKAYIKETDKYLSDSSVNKILKGKASAEGDFKVELKKGKGRGGVRNVYIKTNNVPKQIRKKSNNIKTDEKPIITLLRDHKTIEGSILDNKRAIFQLSEEFKTLSNEIKKSLKIKKYGDEDI